MLFWEGTIKGEHTQTLGLLSGSQTLYPGYISASHGAEHNKNELFVLFIHMHVLRPLGELLVIPGWHPHGRYAV